MEVLKGLRIMESCMTLEHAKSADEDNAMYSKALKQASKGQIDLRLFCQINHFYFKTFCKGINRQLNKL